VQLGRLEAMLARRRELAARYSQLLRGLEVPSEPANGRHGWQSYVVRVKHRERVMERMAAAGIQTRAGVMAAHLEPAYAGNARLPITEMLAAETLALPLYHELCAQDQERVAAALNDS